jgi:hypothetical protein
MKLTWRRGDQFAINGSNDNPLVYEVNDPENKLGGKVRAFLEDYDYPLPDNGLRPFQLIPPTKYFV